MSNNTSFHCHSPEKERVLGKEAQKRLLIACILCFLFMLGELLGGYYSGSLAIMSDAAHMFSDFGSFCISLFVIWLSEKGPRKYMTFGFYRAEALGALATVVIIFYITGILTYLAVQRIKSGDFEIQDDAMMAVAAVAVVFNIVLGLCLNGMCFPGLEGGALVHGHSHGAHSRLREDTDVEIQSENAPRSEKHINIRAALIHVLGDLLQSCGVLFSSVLIKIFGDSCKVVDPICTLIFAVIVLFTTIGVLRDTLKILLEGTPKGIKYDRVINELTQIPEVDSVHDVNLWSLTADLPVSSCHICVSPAADHSKILMEAKRIMKEKFNINKTTIQIEDCVNTSDCVHCKPLTL
eukprot:TRINITY_DN14853_c0_g1_i2.p1 TRINITY_DN14853_c0_g1~~TRINITY_DN14853_c0_g1_i2.p1  ORF type:complete len:370 (-),score=87.80 TRINITY_DN14853_c0_g1_i2:1285-2337(-)